MRRWAVLVPVSASAVRVVLLVATWKWICRRGGSICIVRARAVVVRGIIRVGVIGIVCSWIVFKARLSCVGWKVVVSDGRVRWSWGEAIKLSTGIWYRLCFDWAQYCAIIPEQLVWGWLLADGALLQRLAFCGAWMPFFVRVAIAEAAVCPAGMWLA